MQYPSGLNGEPALITVERTGVVEVIFGVYVDDQIEQAIRYFEESHKRIEDFGLSRITIARALREDATELLATASPNKIQLHAKMATALGRQSDVGWIVKEIESVTKWQSLTERIMDLISSELAAANAFANEVHSAQFE